MQADCRTRRPPGRGARIAAALSALAGSGIAVAVGAADADVPRANIVRNPGAENGTAGTDPASGVAPPDWDRLVLSPTGIAPGGNFQQVRYGFPMFPPGAISATFGGGPNVFGGGEGAGLNPDRSFARQTIVVGGAAPEIDAGTVTATLGGYLGGTGASTDEMRVDAEFLDALGTTVGTITVGPVTPAQRGNVATLLLRTAAGLVPPGTRSVRVTMAATRTDQTTYIDAYADNLSLTLRASVPVSVPLLPPVPAPAGSGPPPVPAGLPAPRLGKTFTASPLRGRVLVSTPPAGDARAAASVPGLRGRRFVALRTALSLPAGSLIDARPGVVRITTAQNRSGKVERAEFLGGVFQVLQSGARGTTELRLKGASFTPCARRARRSQPVIRQLRGKVSGGRFRIGGRYSFATAHTAQWTVSDRCDGTLTRVARGQAGVRERGARRGVKVRSGATHLVRAPRPARPDAS